MSVYEYKLTTRHSELDSSLHINNANYLRYLEEARVSMMKDQHFNMQEVHDSKVEMILYKYVCFFKQQVRYPEKLIVKSEQIQTKKIRGILRQEIFREDATLSFQADAYWAYNGKGISSLGSALGFAEKFGQNDNLNILPFAIQKEEKVNDEMPHNCFLIEVRPYEIDSFQHVNNAVYANYFELGRWSFRKTLFPELDTFRKINFNFVLHKSNINFTKPSYISEKLEVKTWLIILTPFRIIHWQELHDATGVIRASCRSEGCLVNKKGSPVKIPLEILEAYKSMILRRR